MKAGLFPLAQGWQWSVFDDVAVVASDLVDPTLTPDAAHIAPNHIESWTGKILPYGTIRDDGMTSAKHRFRQGQILYSKIRPYLAKAALATFDGLCSADMYPIDTDLEPSFLLRWLLTPWFTNEASRSQGRTVLPKINREGLAVLHVPVAPLNEQRRIVAKLDAVFQQTRAAKARLDRLPALLDKLKRSILAAAFRGDLTKDWRAAHPEVEPAAVLLDRIRAERRSRWEDGLRAKGKDPKKATYEEPTAVNLDGTRSLPGGWAWATVGVLCVIASGQTPAGIEAALRPEGDVPWFRVGDMNAPANKVRMVEAATTLTKGDVRRLGIHARPAGTVIFPKRGGAIATNKKRQLDRPSAYDLNIMGLIAPASIEKYFCRWFDTIDLAGLNNGSTIPQINNGDVEPLRVPVPPLAEQAEIVRALDGALELLDAVLTAVVGQHDRVAALERSALAKAFRGELVPQDPTDEPASVLLDRIRAARAAEPERPRRGRGPRRDDSTVAKATTSSNGHATYGHHDESLDLVAGVFQIDRRLTLTAIAEATGLDAPAVKKALKILVAGGQVQIDGKARSAAYVWRG